MFTGISNNIEQERRVGIPPHAKRHTDDDKEMLKAINHLAATVVELTNVVNMLARTTYNSGEAVNRVGQRITILSDTLQHHMW